MLGYVYGHDREVAQFAVAQLIPALPPRFYQRAWRSARTIERRTAALIAGIVYHNCDPDAGIIEMASMALRLSEELADAEDAGSGCISYPLFVSAAARSVVHARRLPTARCLLYVLGPRFGYEFSLAAAACSVASARRHVYCTPDPRGVGSKQILPKVQASPP